MNLLTIGVILFLAAVMVRSFIRGFLRTLFSMFFLVFVIALSVFISPSMTDYVSKSENITQFVKETTEDLLENASSPAAMGDADSAEELGLAIVGSAMQINGIREVAADRLGDIIMKVIGFLLSLLLAAVIIVVIEIILWRIARRRGVSGVSHFLGMLLGLFRGLIIVWALLAVITTLQFTSQGGALYRQIGESPFLTLLNSHNFLLTYLPKILLSTLS